MKEWYKDWFNSEEYLNVYRHRNETEANLLVDLILKNVNIPPGASVLDLACGTGRHSILFAKENYKVAAVDLSEKLLNIAKCNSSRANVKINFIKADLKDFKVDVKFDLVVNLFTSFGYFEVDEENLRILKIAYRHLKKGGYFVFDFFNRNWVEKHLIAESSEETENGIILQQRSLNNSRVNKRIIINKNGIIQEFLESVRMYCPEELKKEFCKAGFFIKNIFGDYYGNKFDSETSPRIIIISRK